MRAILGWFDLPTVKKLAASVLFTGGISPAVSADLPRKYAGAKRRLGAVGETTFSIEQNSIVAKMVEQLIVIEQIVRIPRMPGGLLIDQISFEDHMTAGFKGAPQSRKQRALKIIDIYDEIIRCGS
jgi:hypothetical protein